MKWFLLLCDLLIPVTMLVFGRWMWKRCPKEVGAAFGYKTRRSTRNQETWQFAHATIGRLWWILGWIALALSAAAALLFFGDESASLSLCGKLTMAQCVLLLVTIPITERALKKRFPDDEGRQG